MQMLALFKEAEAAASATDGLKLAGYSEEKFEIMTDSPYPEGAFGERITKHRLFVFPLVGGIVGLSASLAMTWATQAAYPLITGGKPILSLPPMFIVMYESTLLGAILFSVLGIFFESRLPNLKAGIYDPRITEGYIGVKVDCAPDKTNVMEQLFRKSGAVDVLTKE